MPGNKEYRLARARIYVALTLNEMAQREVENLLRYSHSMAGAHALKGQIAVDAITEAGWRQGGWAGPVEEAETAGAEQWLATAITLDSLNVAAHHALAKLYLYREQWRKAMPVLNRMAGLGLEQGLAQLGRGMALCSLGLFDDAKDAFLKAAPSLGPDIGGLLWDPGWALPMEGGELALGTIHDSTGTSVFWASKDPLLSDGVEVRSLEQARRFAHVTWFFGVPSLRLEGWQTLKGQIYLRYGEPPSRSGVGIDRFSFWRNSGIYTAETAGSNTRAAGGMRPPPSVQPFPAQWWRYSGFWIPIGMGFVTGRQRFVTQNPPPRGESRPVPFVDNLGLYAEHTGKIPELSTIVGFRTPTRLNITTYQFPSGGGATEFVGLLHLDEELSSALIRRTGFAEPPLLHSVVLDLSDGSLKRVLGSPVEAGTSWAQLPYYSDRLLAVGAPVTVPPGNYLLSIEFTAAPDRAWVGRDSLRVESTESKPRVSDIVLATHIERAEAVPFWPKHGVLERSGWLIAPRTDRSFLRLEPIHLYLEIHGLAKDEIGATDYTVSLAVTDQSRGRGVAVLVNRLGEALGIRDRQETVAASWRRSGIDANPIETLRLVVPDPPLGNYQLEIQITDHVIGATTTSTTSFEVHRDRDK
jgi:hypothetical protein